MAIAEGVADAFKGSVEQLSNKIDEIGNRELRKGITKKNQEDCIKNTSLVLESLPILLKLISNSLRDNIVSLSLKA